MVHNLDTPNRYPTNLTTKTKSILNPNNKTNLKKKKKKFMLSGALRAIINKQYKENFDNTFMGNIKSRQKKLIALLFSYKKVSENSY